MDEKKPNIEAKAQPSQKPAMKKTDAKAVKQPSKGQTDPKKTKAKTSVLSDVLLLLLKILIIILIFVLLFTFLFGAVRLNEIAMEPNIKNGDLVLFYRLDKNYVANDCVVYKYQGKTQVMRVVAIAGDEVDITSEGLIINGILQSEPDQTKETLPYAEGIDYPVKLKTGQIFLLGDNRENAEDSRVFGVVRQKETLGEVMTIIRRRNL